MEIRTCLNLTGRARVRELEKFNDDENSIFRRSDSFLGEILAGYFFLFTGTR